MWEVLEQVQHGWGGGLLHLPILTPLRWPWALHTKAGFASCQWYDLDSLEQFPFPLGYDRHITAFQKLLILRCFRVDRVYRAVTDYVTLTMGEK